jgi:hypothetical protein
MMHMLLHLHQRVPVRPRQQSVAPGVVVIVPRLISQPTKALLPGPVLLGYLSAWRCERGLCAGHAHTYCSGMGVAPNRQALCWVRAPLKLMLFEDRGAGPPAYKPQPHTL